MSDRVRPIMVLAGASFVVAVVLELMYGNPFLTGYWIGTGVGELTTILYLWRPK